MIKRDPRIDPKIFDVIRLISSNRKFRVVEMTEYLIAYVIVGLPQVHWIPKENWCINRGKWQVVHVEGED